MNFWWGCFWEILLDYFNFERSEAAVKISYLLKTRWLHFYSFVWSVASNNTFSLGHNSYYLHLFKYLEYSLRVINFFPLLVYNTLVYYVMEIMREISKCKMEWQFVENPEQMHSKCKMHSLFLWMAFINNRCIWKSL